MTDIKNTPLEDFKIALQEGNPKEPGSYADTWQCNIAMGIYDQSSQMLTPEFCNKVAASLMKTCFDVETCAERG